MAWEFYGKSQAENMLSNSQNPFRILCVGHITEELIGGTFYRLEVISAN